MPEVGRRSFLASLLAAPAIARLIPEPMRTFVRCHAFGLEDEEAESVTMATLADELKRAYPPGSFYAMVNAESPFRRALKR